MSVKVVDRHIFLWTTCFAILSSHTRTAPANNGGHVIQDIPPSCFDTFGII